MGKLPARHERFCEEYLKDLNITKAAERSGFSKKTAAQQGARLFKKVNIQSQIQQLMKRRSERTEITQDRVLRELAICGFSDLANHLDIDPDTGAIRAKGFDEMPGASRRALKSIKEDRVIKEDADGRKTTVYDKIRFELHDKLKALELIGRHLAMFNEEAKALGEVIYKLSEQFMPKQK